MTSPKLVEIYPSNFRDPAATLRVIADQIESGKYGQVGCIAVALVGDRLELFGAGPESEWPAVALLFQAGIQRLASDIEQHGK